jgi:hypothetical protein
MIDDYEEIIDSKMEKINALFDDVRKEMLLCLPSAKQARAEISEMINVFSNQYLQILIAMGNTMDEDDELQPDIFGEN